MLMENLNILVTLGSALTVYIFLRKATKKDIEEVKKDIEEIKKQLQAIDQRLTKLEGRFEERGYWESWIYREIGTGKK